MQLLTLKCDVQAGKSLPRPVASSLLSIMRQVLQRLAVQEGGIGALMWVSLAKRDGSTYATALQGVSQICQRLSGDARH